MEVLQLGHDCLRLFNSWCMAQCLNHHFRLPKLTESFEAQNLQLASLQTQQLFHSLLNLIWRHCWRIGRMEAHCNIQGPGRGAAVRLGAHS